MLPKRRFSGRRKFPKHDKCPPESPPQAPPEACPPQALAGEVTFYRPFGVPSWQHPGSDGSSRRIRGARTPAQCQCGPGPRWATQWH